VRFRWGYGPPLYVLGLFHKSDYSAWESMTSRLGIVDLPSFVRVAYIHNASYLGGLIGFIAAVIYLRQQKRSRAMAFQNVPQIRGQ
jgi:hypothetical protein